VLCKALADVFLASCIPAFIVHFLGWFVQDIKSAEAKGDKGKEGGDMLREQQRPDLETLVKELELEWNVKKKRKIENTNKDKAFERKK